MEIVSLLLVGEALKHLYFNNNAYKTNAVNM